MKFLLSLFFGPIYWALKGHWGRAAMCLIVPPLWLIFPFIQPRSEPMGNIVVVNNNDR